jgi:hypothetical protein
LVQLSGDGRPTGPPEAYSSVEVYSWGLSKLAPAAGNTESSPADRGNTGIGHISPERDADTDDDAGIGRRRCNGPSADAEGGGGESGYLETRMQRDFPDAIHVRLRAEEWWMPEPYTVELCSIIPPGNSRTLNDADREGVAVLQ